MADLLGIGRSGLLAFQQGLATTSHNIANAATPGFSRQRVDLVTNPAEFTGAGFIGNGVRSAGVERLYDQFQADRVRSAGSGSARFDSYAQQAAGVSDILGDATAGLQAGLSDFFAANQDLASDPGAAAARQALLSEGDTLAQRYQVLDQRLGEAGREADLRLREDVAAINDLANGIAELNQTIAREAGRATGGQPNDLLDQRDRLIDELSQRVNIRTFEQDGAVNVMIGNGQSLVTRFSAASLEVGPGRPDASRSEIYYRAGDARVPVGAQLGGGSLGGTLAVRSEVLEPARNELGRLAVAFAESFNLQHGLGIDQNGDVGGDFFRVPQPEVQALADNAGSGSLTVGFDRSAIDALQASDYELRFDGANYQLRRLSDGSNVSLAGSGSPADPFTADGLSLVVGGAPAAGDSFLVRPYVRAAGGLETALSDPRDLAAAAPGQVSEATDALGNPVNLGDGRIELVAAEPGYTPLSAGISFSYDAATQTFNYSGDASGSFAYDPAIDAGSEFTVAGFRIQVSGTPQTGDGFDLQPTAASSGDNGNALALGDLQTAALLDGGSTSIQGGYAQLVAETGSRTRAAEVNGQAQRGLYNQALAAREAVSGVNLDEEAANLIRLQQSYQAMAQVISAADQSFQVLLNAVGR